LLGGATTLARALWAAAALPLLVLAFPFRAGELRFDLGLVFGWLALVPFARFAGERSARRAFAWATLAGTLGYAGVMFWIYHVVTVHGRGPGWLGVLAVFALAFYIAAHAGLASGLGAWLGPRAGRFAPVVFAAAWVVAEWLRTFDVFGGFPWALQGYAAHADPALRGLAPLGGVWLLSFVFALGAALLAERRLTAALATLVVAHALGLAQGVLAPPSAAPGNPPRVAAIVQGNVPQEEKWVLENFEQAFDGHLALSRAGARDGVDVILWPETALPVLLEYEPSYRERVQRVALDTHAALLVGGMGFEPPRDGAPYRVYNSVFAIAPDGAFGERYDKARLVPFGEYVPLRPLLGPLFALAGGLAQVDATPGPGPRVLELERLGSDHALAPLICYEVIYPDLVRRAVRDGAHVLANFTNDAWYGRSSAPHQFLAIAALRSAETGRAMLRAANTGVSAFIHADGSIASETEIFEPAVLRGSIDVATAQTLYVRVGDWVVWASVGLLVGLGGRRVAAGRRASGPGGADRSLGADRARGGAAEAPLTSRESARG
jgi:apolipoprotein N-acyltransferase